MFCLTLSPLKCVTLLMYDPYRVSHKIIYLKLVKSLRAQIPFATRLLAGIAAPTPVSSFHSIFLPFIRQFLLIFVCSLLTLLEHNYL